MSTCNIGQTIHHRTDHAKTGQVVGKTIYGYWIMTGNRRVYISNENAAMGGLMSDETIAKRNSHFSERVLQMAELIGLTPRQVQRELQAMEAGA